jgi:hypothetical protein
MPGPIVRGPLPFKNLEDQQTALTVGYPLRLFPSFMELLVALVVPKDDDDAPLMNHC